MNTSAIISAGPPEYVLNSNVLDAAYDHIIKWYSDKFANAIDIQDSGEVRVNVHNLPIISIPPPDYKYPHLESMYDLITQYYNNHIVGLHPAAIGDTPISGDYELPRLSPPLREYSPLHHMYCTYLEYYFRQYSLFGLWMEAQRYVTPSRRVAMTTNLRFSYDPCPAPSHVVTARGDNNQNRSNEEYNSASANSV